jgi:signal transduction histidine kinase
VSAGDARSGSQRLAEVLLGEVERIAERSVAKMQELLPSYAGVPREELVPVTLANMRNLLEAIRDPDRDRGREQEAYLASGGTRARQGIASDEMLQAWRIGLDGVREAAHEVAEELGLGNDVLLEFVEATLRWGDVGMSASVSGHHEAEVRELGRLAREQAALRRVATLVAREFSPEEVFAKVAEEVGLLLGANAAAVWRYDAEGDATVVGSWGEPRDAAPVGRRVTLDEDSLAALVHRTGRPVRVDDYEHVSGSLAVGTGKVGVRSAVGSLIFVNGRLWGSIVAAMTRTEPMPADAESRIAQFGELVATAIANAQARSDLAASRARIVAAADEERRRVVRDLHDGAQQRLVHTIVTLKLAGRALERDPKRAAALLSEARQHAQAATQELRELAHGILPSILTHGGLVAGVRDLASRMPIPVEIGVSVDRLPGAIEATAYFIVAEALTNVAKHSRAHHAAVRARVESGVLRVEVRDDGVGGAQADATGLVGLRDRLAVLDGSLRVDSPPDGGTLIAACIPVR